MSCFTLFIYAYFLQQRLKLTTTRANFPKVVEFAKTDESKYFTDQDRKIFKHLMNPETGFHRGQEDPRFIELLRLYSRNYGFGFKVDLDAVVGEYGIDHLLEVLKGVIDGGMLL